jgi:putative transcriptional regulator
MPTHHPDDSLLLEYAAGSLSEAKALLVATHLALCPACRLAVRSGEAAGAALAFAEDAAVAVVAPPDVSGEEIERLASPGTIACPSVPEPLRSYLGAPVAELAWQGAGLGVKAYRLPEFRGATSVRLLSIPPGRRMPRHTHMGEELTLVLRGSFSDATGAYLKGDVATADQRIDHQPHAGAEEECLCLAVEDAPLRFTGWRGGILSAAAWARGLIR